VYRHGIDDVLKDAWSYHDVLEAIEFGVENLVSSSRTDFGCHSQSLIAACAARLDILVSEPLFVELLRRCKDFAIDVLLMSQKPHLSTPTRLLGNVRYCSTYGCRRNRVTDMKDINGLPVMVCHRCRGSDTLSPRKERLWPHLVVGTLDASGDQSKKKECIVKIDDMD
jgi:hypothetical protein